MGQYTSGPSQPYGLPPSTHLPHSAYEAAREHSQRMAAFETMRSAYHPTGIPQEGVITPSGHGMYCQVCSTQTLTEMQVCARTLHAAPASGLWGTPACLTATGHDGPRSGGSWGGAGSWFPEPLRKLPEP